MYIASLWLLPVILLQVFLSSTFWYKTRLSNVDRSYYRSSGCPEIQNQMKPKKKKTSTKKSKTHQPPTTYNKLKILKEVEELYNASQVGRGAGRITYPQISL